MHVAIIPLVLLIISPVVTAVSKGLTCSSGPLLGDCSITGYQATDCSGNQSKYPDDGKIPGTTINTCPISLTNGTLYIQNATVNCSTFLFYCQLVFSAASIVCRNSTLIGSFISFDSKYTYIAPDCKLDVSGQGRHQGPGFPSFQSDGASHGGSGGKGSCSDSVPIYYTYTQDASTIIGDPVYPYQTTFWNTENAYGSGTAGHVGGGKIMIKSSASLRLDGKIIANGDLAPSNDSQLNGGGAAGGTVVILASNITGTGSIFANGGDSLIANKGGGGGGRVSIWHQNDTDFQANFNIYAKGGLGLLKCNTGGAGTIFQGLGSGDPINIDINSLGTLKFDNAGNLTYSATPYSVASNLHSISIGGGAVVTSNNLIISDFPSFYAKYSTNIQNGLSIGFNGVLVPFNVEVASQNTSFLTITSPNINLSTGKIIIVQTVLNPPFHQPSSDLKRSNSQILTPTMVPSLKISCNNFDLETSSQIRYTGLVEIVSSRNPLSPFTGTSDGSITLRGIIQEIEDTQGSLNIQASNILIDNANINTNFLTMNAYENITLMGTTSIISSGDSGFSCGDKPEILYSCQSYPSNEMVLANFTFFAISDYMFIDSGASVSGPELVFCSNLIEIEGDIDATSRGCPGGMGMGKGTASSSLTASGGGAGHGGKGGDSAEVGGLGGEGYGNMILPSTTGSGGGSNSNSGGNGGGLIVIRATSVSVSGTIESNGDWDIGQQPTGNNAGGGSGGSIYIYSREIAGVGGEIFAKGGNTKAAGGGGSGGRIMFDFSQHTNQNSTYSKNGGVYSVSGGNSVSGHKGSDGTVSSSYGQCDPGKGTVFCQTCPTGMYSTNKTLDSCKTCDPHPLNADYDNSAERTSPACAYNCKPSFIGPQCLLPFDELMRVIENNPYYFVGICIGMMIIISFISYSFIQFKKKKKEGYNLLEEDVNNSSTTDPLLRFSTTDSVDAENLGFNTYLHENNLSRHYSRLYFVGFNIWYSPWTLCKTPPNELAHLVNEESYIEFVYMCNAAIHWDKYGWERIFYNLLILLCYPMADKFLRWRQSRRAKVLRDIVRLPSSQFMRGARALALLDSLKFGVSCDRSLAYIDILIDPANAPPETVIGKPSLPMALIFCGNGTLDCPVQLEINDVLVRCIPTMNALNKFIDTAWLDFVSELNCCLRSVNLNSLDCSLGPTFKFVNNRREYPVSTLFEAGLQISLCRYWPNSRMNAPNNLYRTHTVYESGCLLGLLFTSSSESGINGVDMFGGPKAGIRESALGLADEAGLKAKESRRISDPTSQLRGKGNRLALVTSDRKRASSNPFDPKKKEGETNTKSRRMSNSIRDNALGTDNESLFSKTIGALNSGSIFFSEFSSAVKSDYVQPIDFPMIGAVYLPGCEEAMEKNTPCLAKIYYFTLRVITGNYIPVKTNFHRIGIITLLLICLTGDLVLLGTLTSDIWCIEDSINPDTCEYWGLTFFVAVYPLAILISPLLILIYFGFSLNRYGRMSIKWNLLSILNIIVCIFAIAPSTLTPTQTYITSISYLLIKLCMNSAMHAHLAILESSRDGIGWKSLKTIHKKTLSPLVTGSDMARKSARKSRRESA